MPAHDLLRLLELEAVPILNENDSLSVREIVELRAAEAGEDPGQARVEPVFGDNDGLSARFAAAIVDGLFTANPHGQVASDYGPGERPFERRDLKRG